MLVVSYLPSQLLPRLTDAVNDVGADHVGAETLSHVEEVVRERPDGVIVLDPYADKTMRAREVARILRHYPTTPIIAYTQFVPPAMRAIALLSKRGLHETVLFQFDDGRARFGRVLVRASIRALVSKMLHGLQYEFANLDAPVVKAVQDMFQRPHQYASARDLVRISGTPLTSLYRAFYSAGLEPPKKMFIAARVLHAAAYLRDPSYTIQEIADKLSYRHPRVLTQHTLSVFRRRPTVLRREVTDERLIARLLEWVRRD